MQGLDRAVGERLPTPVEPRTLSRSFFVISNMQGLNFLRVDLERGRSTARMSQFDVSRMTGPRMIVVRKH